MILLFKYCSQHFFIYLLLFAYNLFPISIYFLPNHRSKINDEEKKKMSESVLRYHDQIAAHTMTIAKLKEDMIKEQQSKCVLEDRLAKAGNQTVRLDEEITQLKAMSNVNALLNFIILPVIFLIQMFLTPSHI